MVLPPLPVGQARFVHIPTQIFLDVPPGTYTQAQLAPNFPGITDVQNPALQSQGLPVTVVADTQYTVVAPVPPPAPQDVISPENLKLVAMEALSLLYADPMALKNALGPFPILPGGQPSKDQQRGPNKHRGEASSTSTSTTNLTARVRANPINSPVQSVATLSVTDKDCLRDAIDELGLLSPRTRLNVLRSLQPDVRQHILSIEEEMGWLNWMDETRDELERQPSVAESEASTTPSMEELLNMLDPARGLRRYLQNHYHPASPVDHSDV